MSAARARRTLQAGHRGEGGPQRERRQGGALAHRARWRAPTASMRRRSGAPVCCASASWTSCSAPPRSSPGIRRSPASGSRSSPMAAAPACSPPTASAISAARWRVSPTRTRSALDAVLPPTWSHGNPVDIIGDADPARYAAALEVVLASDDADAILVMNCPTALASSTEIAERVTVAVERHKTSGRATKAVIANWLGDEASPRRTCAVCAEGHRQLCDARRGGRRVHVPGALHARAGRADAHPAVAPCRFRGRQGESRCHDQGGDRGRALGSLGSRSQGASDRLRHPHRSHADCARSCRGRRIGGRLHRGARRLRGEDPLRRHFP